MSNRTSLPLVPHINEQNDRAPVFGISEWHSFYGNSKWYEECGLDLPQEVLDEPQGAVEECIDAHRAVGINRIIWSCGRSTVIYQSELENATVRDDYVGAVLRKICLLRHAIAYCKKNEIPILGRLAMNRHYGPERPNVVSRFAREHPQFFEKGKLSEPVTHRLCYAIPEVQKERIDILLEIQRLGVNGLLLDFCRQMPVLMYHEALVEPYIEQTGEDPREIYSTRPEEYREWFQFRADVLTEFMRRLSKEVRRQEDMLGRGCPLIARVPDAPAWLTIAYGLDVERWHEEGLIAGTMLSPFPRVIEDTGRHPEYHVGLAHKYGNYCIGGVGHLNLCRADPHKPGTIENRGFFHPKPAFQLVEDQYQAGVDAMSIYQSETVTRLDYLKDFIGELGDRDLVSQRVRELKEPKRLEWHGSSSDSIGLDWHSAWCPPNYRKGESLSTHISGNNAL